MKKTTTLLTIIISVILLNSCSKSDDFAQAESIQPKKIDNSSFSNGNLSFIVTSTKTVESIISANAINNQPLTFGLFGTKTTNDSTDILLNNIYCEYLNGTCNYNPTLNWDSSIKNYSFTAVAPYNKNYVSADNNGGIVIKDYQMQSHDMLNQENDNTNWMVSDNVSIENSESTVALSFHSIMKDLSVFVATSIQNQSEQIYLKSFSLTNIDDKGSYADNKWTTSRSDANYSIGFDNQRLAVNKNCANNDFTIKTTILPQSFEGAELEITYIIRQIAENGNMYEETFTETFNAQEIGKLIRYDANDNYILGLYINPMGINFNANIYDWAIQQANK